VVYETGSGTMIYLYILVSLFHFYFSLILAFYFSLLSFLFRLTFVYLEWIVVNTYR
jgi:hypothetical protein